MRISNPKRFGAREVKKGNYKGALHISTKSFQNYRGEILYLSGYLSRRILPSEPEEQPMKSILIDLINIFDIEIETIIFNFYKKFPSNEGIKIKNKINNGYMGFKAKMDWILKNNFISSIEYDFFDELRILRNKHTHYKHTYRRPRYQYLKFPLMTLKSLRNIFIDSAFILQRLRKLSGNTTKWQVIPPGYSKELKWGNVHDIFHDNLNRRNKSLTTQSS